MIQQILVVDPAGPLLLDRTYADNEVDPHIISGFLAAVLPRKKKLGFDLEKINKEMNKNASEYNYFEAVTIKKWIIAGFATNDLYVADLILLLNDIGNIVYSALGAPIGYSMIENTIIDGIIRDIDNLLVARGIRVDSMIQTKDNVYELLKQIYRGKIKINTGINRIIDEVERGNYNKEGLDSIIKAISKIDKKTKRMRKN